MADSGIPDNYDYTCDSCDEPTGHAHHTDEKHEFFHTFRLDPAQHLALVEERYEDLLTQRDALLDAAKRTVRWWERLTPEERLASGLSIRGGIAIANLAAAIKQAEAQS